MEKDMNKVTQARKEAGLTVPQAAKLVGVSERQWYRYEAKGEMPKIRWYRWKKELNRWCGIPEYGP